MPLLPAAGHSGRREPWPVQFIIADNQLPIDYRRDYAQMDFTYHRPPSRPSSTQALKP